jgi:hypothetical protein
LPAIQRQREDLDILNDVADLGIRSAEKGRVTFENRYLFVDGPDCVAGSDAGAP